MTTQSATPIRTGLARTTDLSLSELLSLRATGDTALDHCLRRVVETAALPKEDRVAAFNAALTRRP